MRHNVFPAVVVAYGLLASTVPAGSVPTRQGAPISANHPGVLTLELDAGDFLHVAVAPQDVDITLELTAPDGNSIWTSDDRPTWDGLEQVWVVSETTGRYRLTVASRWGEPGSYRIESIEHHPATAAERQRAEAERALHEAKRTRRRKGSDYAAALRLVREARQGFERIELPRRAAAAQAEEAVLLSRLGRRDEAVATLNSLLAAAREAGDPGTAAQALNGLSIRAYERGDLDAAVDRLRRAEAMIDTTVDRYLAARIELNLGLFLSYAGDNREALVHYQRGRDEATRIGWLDGEATAWFNSSLAYSGLRDYAATLKALRRADALFGRVGQPIDQARMRMNEGVLRYRLGDLEGAAERYRQVLDVLPPGEVVERARAELNLGQVALRAGDLATARTRVESCLAQIRGKAETKLEGFALIALSEIDRRQDRLQQAVTHAHEAVEIGRSSGVGRILPQALVSLAEAERRQGVSNGVDAILDQAVAAAQGSGDPEKLAQAQLVRARLRRDEGKFHLALREVEVGIEAIESVRREVPTLPLRATYLSRFRKLYDLAIQLRYALNRREPDAGHAAAAFELVERARARSLLESLPALDWRTDEPSRRFRELGAALVAARQKLAVERADPQGSETARAEAARRLDLAIADYEKARTAWISAHPREQTRLERRAATLAEVQSALDPGDLLLEYHVGEDSVFLFSISHDRFDFIPLGDSHQLERDVAALLPLLVRPSLLGAARYRNAALRLYRRVVAPAHIGALDAHRLLISADGPLRNIPFEALVRTSSGDSFDRLDYLARYTAVSYLPSAAVGLELRAHGGRENRSGTALVSFADPPVPVQEAQDVLRRPIASSNLPPLPNTRREVSRLARLFTPSQTWIGAQASEARFRHLTETPPRRLHLATHAVVDERRPELSALVLAAGDGEDGVLEAWEIATMRLPVQQVVLSSCSSARGRPVAGEGLVGLVQAFIDAGANSVIASLWPVSDVGTSDFMVRFYRALEARGPAESLARARRAEIARGGLAAHPSSWASFVRIGWFEPAAATHSAPGP